MRACKKDKRKKKELNRLDKKSAQVEKMDNELIRFKE